MRETSNAQCGLGCEQVDKLRRFHVVKQARGDHDGPVRVGDGNAGRERVASDEVASKLLSVGQALRLSDQSRIEVNADKFNAIWQMAMRGNRSHDMSQPAAHVDDSYRRTIQVHQSIDMRPQQGRHTPVELQLFTQPLELAMDPQRQSIQVRPIDLASVLRHPAHDPCGPVLAALLKLSYGSPPHHRHARTG